MNKPHRYRPSQELRIIRGPIKPEWKGQTVTLIGGGPSLTTAQIVSVKEGWWAGLTRVIGVNDAYRIAPWIDGLYAADPPWWEMHIKAIRDTHIPLLMCQDFEAASRWGLRHVAGPPSKFHGYTEGISTDPEYIHFGSNSGFQAMNIAFHLGAKRIILVGYDMKATPGKPSHWFGDHPPGLVNHYGYSNWVISFEQAAPQLAEAGVEVINCTPDSAIKCFPSRKVSDVLRAYP